MTRVVVAIDPAVTSGDEADETDIIVAGKDQNGHGDVLADLPGRYPPIEWARPAITAYRTHRADRIVAEVNNGGDMVGATLRMVDPNVAFTAVRASRGKMRPGRFRDVLEIPGFATAVPKDRDHLPPPQSR